jgi:uncharacterized protein (TIGR03435 family)
MRQPLVRAATTMLAMGSVFAQISTAPSFAVASVKPSLSEPQESSVRLAPNGARVTAVNASPRRLIMRAYTVADWQITGGPAWLDSDRYDVDAKPERPASNDDLYAMLRALLAERFKLKIHTETVEKRYFALLVDNGGPKLKPHQPGGNDQELADWSGTSTSRHAVLNNVGMPRLVLFLAIQSGQDIVDKTGLTGRYDLTLDYAPQRNISDIGVFNSRAVDPSQPELFSAVNKQLRLRLQPERGPVQRLHVDGIERPTAN